MKPTLNGTPRAERTLDYYFDQIMNSVVEMYLLCVPEHDIDTFKEVIYEPLKALEVSGDLVMRYFAEAGGTSLGKGDATLLTCIYCIQSKWANVDGHVDLAWSYIMRAQRYITMAIAEDVSEPQLAKVLDIARTEAKTNAARESVTVSVQPWWETKQEAFRLIREEAGKGRRWPNAGIAALEILASLKEFLKTREAKKRKAFTSQTPESTVEEWLLEMPEADILFGVHTENIDKFTK